MLPATNLSSLASALQPVLAALGEGATVVTANKRTAAWIAERYDAAQAASEHAAWATPSIMPWATWVRGLWQSLRAEGDRPGVQLLTPWQEQRIWATIIASDDGHSGLHLANAAALAAGAWEVVHGWRGQWAQWGGAGARPEHRAFVSWAKGFARECAANDWIDAARVPQLIVDTLSRRAAPRMAPVAFFGFTEFTPNQQALIDALGVAGVRTSQCVVEGQAGENSGAQVKRVRCGDPAGEWRQCAQWCRERLLREPDATLGVVIPDLALQRPQVERIFREVLAPGSLFAETAGDPPFNISHADPLAQQPLVATALTLLGWTQSPISPMAIATLARSPHLSGHEREWSRRALAARDVIKEPRASWRPEEFAQFIGRHCPEWSERLIALTASSATWRKGRPAKDWRRSWEEALDAAGWLTETTLNSLEHQARSASSGLLDTWMRAETISGRMTFSDAYSSLAKLAADTAFQPERGPVPVQILGTLEAAGLYFDGLWICGLTAERWPAAPQPSPLLPLAWQRMVQAPHASAERELRYFRELTAGFARAAPTVIFSWPESIDGVPAAPSPLLVEFAPAPESTERADPVAPLAMRMVQKDRLEAWEDGIGVPLDPQSAATGRVALLDAQASCPFQAYASFRLQVEPWPRRSDGLTLAERGTLVHAMLAEFWQGLPDQEALLALEGDAWTARCARAVRVAIATFSTQRWALLGDTFVKLERERLQGLLRDWLEVEYGRPPFAVVDTESKHTVVIDGLELRLKVDRIDRIGNNELVVIDFKTGKSTIANLLREERLLAPQLPLYAEALKPAPVTALAYATVRRGETKVVGVAASSETWDALKASDPDWPSLRARWSTQLRDLVGGYRRGLASVDPWQYPGTCNRCGRHALCRINERIAFAEGDRGAADAFDDGEDAR